jgi:putative intracellular protease/amidase
MLVRVLRTLLRFVIFCSLTVQGAFAETNFIRVALFDDAGVAGKGVPRVTELLKKTSDIKVSKVTGSQVAAGALTNFDVVMFTGGSGSKQAGALGEQGRENVRRFVREGGGYIGICAGAYLACSGYSWGIGVLNAKPVSSKWARGKGKVEIEMTSKGEALTSLPSGRREILYANGPIIQPGDQKDIAAYEPIAFFRTELAKNGTPEGVMIDSPAMVRGTFGKGRVLFSSPHPEQTSGMEEFIPASVRWASGKTVP